MRRVVIAIILLILLPPHPTLWSACVDNGGGVWTTDGNESADVVECVNAASAGNTINVIAGDGESDWGGSAVTIPSDKPLKIIGPGASLLTINLTGNYAFIIDDYVSTATVAATRISGFTFVSPHDAQYYAIMAKGQGWRIDHNVYNNITDISSSSVFVLATSINSSIDALGVIDNNTIYNSKIACGGFSTFLKMSGVWDDALTLGSGGGAKIFIEDNVFISNTTAIHQFADANYAAKYVFRYNTLTHGWLQVHGLQTDSSRGPVSWEIYGNSFTDNIYSNGPITLLAGTGTVFNNNFVSSDPEHAYAGTLILNHERTTNAYGDAGLCNGESGWDGNQDATGWPCRDQIGTSTDASLWDDEDTLPAPSQSLAPAYIWGMIMDGTPNAPTNGAETHIQINRDYYAQSGTGVFNGTGAADTGGGVGCGTAATMNAITTCTDGVGFWVPNATDDPTAASCSNLTGFVGASPTYYGKGTLYKCSSNTWIAYYTPYTYPHPLRGEGGTTYYTLTVTQPTRGTITTPEGINCGSGGSICTMEYDSTTSAVLTFTPDTEWRFSSASDDCTGTARGATCTLAMSAAKTAGATFVVQERVPWFKP